MGRPIIRLKVGLGAAPLLIFAAGASAQSCVWTEHAPPPPGFGVVVYHAGLQRVLHLSNNNGVRISAWDGTQWTLLDPYGPPDLGRGAYDSARDRLVLFGGYHGGTVLRDTWEWDRSSWMLASSGGPPARSGCGMAYDEARRRVVLFGGEGNYPQLFSDTWEWDGQTWTQVATTGPAPRAVLAMAYNPVRARTLLCGGFGFGRDTVTDLWEWDGAAWTQQPGAVPGPGAWMVFDPGRARMIVGIVLRIYESDSIHQTWELDGALQWTPRDPGMGAGWFAAFDIPRSRTVALDEFYNTTLEYDGSATGVGPYIIQQPVGGGFAIGQTVHLAAQVGGTTPMSFQWYRAGQPLANGGRISGATTDTLTIDPVTTSDWDSYRLVAANGCFSVSTFETPVGHGCYVNCDNSTTPPYLNINDFVCFLNAFAAGDMYANCDGSCNPPPCLTVLDFGCFLNKFVAGCSGP